MKHAVVMTLPSSKFDVYGYCMRGFIENWPNEVTGYAIVEEPEKIPLFSDKNFVIPDNLIILDFDKVCGKDVRAFEERNKDKPIFNMGVSQGNFREQAAKFARKAFAQLYVLENIDADIIWYIDADLYTYKPVTMELLEKLSSTDAYIGCTPRWWKPNGYTETGLMMWKKHMTEVHKEWCDLYSSCYNGDKIFEVGSPGKNLPFKLPDAWHDCIAFDYATKSLLHEKKIELADFGFGVRSGHPLVSGPLGKYMDHMKGKRKFVGASHERLKMHGN